MKKIINYINTEFPKASLGIVIVGVILSFQNCSRAQFRSIDEPSNIPEESISSASSTSTTMSANGTASDNIVGAHNPPPSTIASSTSNLLAYFVSNGKIINASQPNDLVQLVVKTLSSNTTQPYGFNLDGYFGFEQVNIEDGISKHWGNGANGLADPLVTPIPGSLTLSEDGKGEWIFISSPLAAKNFFDINADGSLLVRSFNKKGVAVGLDIVVTLDNLARIRQSSPLPVFGTTCSYSGQGYSSSGVDTILGGSLSYYTNNGQECRSQCGQIGAKSWFVANGMYCHCGSDSATFSSGNVNVNYIGGNCL